MVSGLLLIRLRKSGALTRTSCVAISVNKQKKALKQYVNYNGEEERKAMLAPEKQPGKPDQNRLDSEEPPHLKLYQADKRQPKKKDGEERKEARDRFEEQKINIRNISQDPRDRLLRARNQLQANLGQKKENRPNSNQLDRFGRVKQDKNRELSQASLDVDSDQPEQPG